MAVGLPAKTTYVDGDVFSASDINDTNGTLNLVGQTTNFYAAKNRFLNASFDNWQRGTSFTLATATPTYCADRFLFTGFGSGTAATVTRQTFTPGAAPVAGYEGQYFARLTNFATATAWQIRQRIENVQTFAGQTVTFSFWAKASTARTGITYESIQNFGSGGSTAVTVALASGQTLSTSWTRYSITTAVASITGKTIGASSYLEFNIYEGSGAANSSTIDTWGWQVEAGSVATAFQTATGTIQGELAACQRYYWRVYPYLNTSSSAGSPYARFGSAYAGSTTQVSSVLPLPVPMRAAPTSVEGSGTASHYAVVSLSVIACSAVPSYDSSTQYQVTVVFTVASGLVAGQGVQIAVNNAAAAYLGFSAEL
jgi:hypothetical protein